MKNNNNLVNESVNENERMIETVDEYAAWLNSDESDDLANAYAEAYGDDTDNLVVVKESTMDGMMSLIETQNQIIKEKDKMLKEAYIQMDVAIDKTNEILDNAII